MRKKRDLWLAFVVMLGLLFSLSACQSNPGGDGQGAENNPLVGDWVQDSPIDPAFMRLAPDGSFALARIYNDLEKFPALYGTYTYESSVLTIHSEEFGPTTKECIGQSASYSVVFDDGGNFTLEDIEAGPCLIFNYFSSESYPWAPYQP